MSKIERNITLRLAAANQHIAVGGWIDRIGLITHVAGDERRLAGVTDTGAARPSHRQVTRLGKLEQALERRTPSDIKPAAREGYERSGAGRSRRQMWRLSRGRNEARGEGWLRSKDFGVKTAA